MYSDTRSIIDFFDNYQIHANDSKTVSNGIADDVEDKMPNCEIIERSKSRHITFTCELTSLVKVRII